MIAAAGDLHDFRKAGDKLVAVYPESAHDFRDAGRQHAYEWLDRWLK